MFVSDRPPLSPLSFAGVYVCMTIPCHTIVYVYVFLFYQTLGLPLCVLCVWMCINVRVCYLNASTCVPISYCVWYSFVWVGTLLALSLFGAYIAQSSHIPVGVCVCGQVSACDLFPANCT